MCRLKFEGDFQFLCYFLFSVDKMVTADPLPQATITELEPAKPVEPEPEKVVEPVTEEIVSSRGV